MLLKNLQFVLLLYNFNLFFYLYNAGNVDDSDSEKRQQNGKLKLIYIKVIINFCLSCFISKQLKKILSYLAQESHL